jgi:hypothetical protein
LLFLFPFPPLRARLILKFLFSYVPDPTWNTWNNFTLEPKYVHSPCLLSSGRRMVLRGTAIEILVSIKCCSFMFTIVAHRILMFSRCCSIGSIVAAVNEQSEQSSASQFLLVCGRFREEGQDGEKMQRVSSLSSLCGVVLWSNEHSPLHVLFDYSNSLMLG